MAQKILNGVHISGTTQLDFMPDHESEGIITLGRYDSNTSRYHNIKSYVSSTEASNYLKFSLHNGTENAIVDVLTLNGNKNATFAGTLQVDGSNLGIGGTPANASHGSVLTKLDIKGGADSIIILRGAAGGTGSDAYIASEYGLYSYDGEFMLTRTNQSSWWASPDLKLSGGNATFAGSVTAGSFIKSGGTSAQYLMANGSVTTGGGGHNHDSRYTSIDASGDNYTFEIEDEGSFSGNKWYHIANINSYNGGLHIRGAILNHVENFASQKLDIAIQVREAGSGSNVEINGTVDVHHNDAATNSTNKAGVRVIQTSTGNTSYQDYKVYVRTTQYSQLTLRLTQQGSVTFNTNHTSPLTSEPAPASGGSMELDTSALLEGHHVVVDSAVKLTVATDAATFAGSVTAHEDLILTASSGQQNNITSNTYLDIGVAKSAHNAAGYTTLLYAGQPTAGTTNNVAGGHLYLAAGGGKGTGAGGDIIFRVAPVGSSGSTLNAYETALTISDDKSATFAGGIKVVGPASHNTIQSANAYVLGLNDQNGTSQWWFNAYTNGNFAIHENLIGDKFTIAAGGNATFAGSVNVKNALIDNASVTSATTTTVVASISGSTYAAVFFDYVAYKSSSIRAGIVTACSDGTNVSFSETSTTDLGDTSDVTLSVDISGGNFRLLATTASSTWNIKSLIRAI